MIQALLMSLLVSTAVGAFPQQGDLSELDRALKKADERIATSKLVSFRNIESLIVWSAGAIRFEKYYNGASPDSLHQIQSQTKSVVSLLMGIAIDQKLVGSEQETVSRWFPESFNAEDDPMKSSVTIRDLLTMSSGFRWEEMLPFVDPKKDNMNMYKRR
ncbi:MAG: serine hydrolase [Candidatus Aminicenantales bacterium]